VARVAPLLVIEKVRKKSGRPRTSDRQILDGLIWLARTGAQWDALPREVGAKSTVHDRFQPWIRHGAFARAWAVLLEEYDDLVGIDWTWQAADGCIVKAPLGIGDWRRGASQGAQPYGPGQER
jgi:putative transposase